MECPGDLAWICLSFPALLPAIAMLAQAGTLELTVDHTLWRTDYGTLEMVALDDTVVARYPAFDGVILGRLDAGGTRLTGVWVQPKSEKTCPAPPPGIDPAQLEMLGLMGIAGTPQHWGRVSFRIGNDGVKLLGQWAYCGDPIAGDNAWNGERLSHEARFVRLPH